MSTHQRKVIRDAVVAQLIHSVTQANERVFPNRVSSTWRQELPAIYVFSISEAAQTLHVSTPPQLYRTLTLAVQALAKGVTGIDDKLDDLADEIEAAMASDETFGGNAQQSTLTSTEVDIDETAETPLGVIRLSYEVKYIYR